jgi:TrpR-related protein YerC/YecD
MAKWDNSKTEDLMKATLALKSVKEAKRFFRDLLTKQEIIEFGKRWQVAQMLSNRIPYPLIRKETGLSPTTIARVSKWLNRGKGGYKLILQRLHHYNQLL